MADFGTAARIAVATFRRKIVSVLAFAGTAAFFHALIAVSFPAIGGMPAVESVVQTLPDGLRNLLRIAPNLQAGFGLRDYLAFSWFHPLFLGMGAAFVVQRATDAIAGEIENGGIYLTMSRPVPRRVYTAGKASEMIGSVGLMCLAGWAGLALGARTLPAELPLRSYLLAALMAWLLFSALGAGALVASSLASRESVSVGIGTAWTLIALFLDVIPRVANSALGVINPWHHYFPQEIVASGRVPVASVVVLGLWILGGVTVAALLFRRRDLV